MTDESRAATPRNSEIAAFLQGVTDAWGPDEGLVLSVGAWAGFRRNLLLAVSALRSETATPEFVVCHDNGEIVNIQHQGVIYVPESASRVAHSMSEYRRVKAMGGNVQLPASRCVAVPPVYGCVCNACEELRRYERNGNRNG